MRSFTHLIPVHLCFKLHLHWPSLSICDERCDLYHISMYVCNRQCR